jgi:hypothetical protein
MLSSFVLRRVAWIGVLALAPAFSLFGCNKDDMKTTSIRALMDNPGQYDDKTVRIAGEVEDSAGVLGVGTYKVNDGTGSIRVLAKSGGVPSSGAKVGVEGEFDSAYTFGDDTGAVIVEAKRYTP